MVKASDSKSDSLWERRFESCQLRIVFKNSDKFRLPLDDVTVWKYKAVVSVTVSRLSGSVSKWWFL